MRRLLIVFACLMILVAGAPAVAAAKSKSHKSSTSTSHTLSPTPPGSSMPTSAGDGQSGTLPYTGLNLWASAVIGVGLLGTGLVLRRVVSPR